MSTIIKLRGEARTRKVWINGKELKPYRSQKVRNHSPDGFNWGYGGSGPAQLALAVVLEVNGNAKGYQRFKFDVIAKIPIGHDFSETIQVPNYE